MQTLSFRHSLHTGNYRRKSVFACCLNKLPKYDIVINRISADFPEDVIAAGDVSLGTDTSNEIIIGGTIQKPNGKNYYLAFGGSNRTLQQS